MDTATLDALGIAYSIQSVCDCGCSDFGSVIVIPAQSFGAEK